MWYVHASRGGLTRAYKFRKSRNFAIKYLLASIVANLETSRVS